MQVVWSDDSGFVNHCIILYEPLSPYDLNFLIYLISVITIHSTKLAFEDQMKYCMKRTLGSAIQSKWTVDTGPGSPALKSQPSGQVVLFHLKKQCLGSL